MKHTRFVGELTARDCKRHIQLPFTVPAHTKQIEISLSFAPERVHGFHNMLTLTLFDPNGFRGAGHRGGANHQVFIDANSATPGYLPGHLPTGEWVAQIDSHMIMPGEPLHYWLDVTVTTGDATAPTVDSPRKSTVRPQRGPGWYRGDLHSHTNHSDAGDRTVVELVQMARDHGLDFLFLTDHNTTSSLSEVLSMADAAFLTAGGIELTTFWGHALCLGARQWVDWRVRPGSGEIARIAAESYAADQVFVIAHPNSGGDPGCTGCAWRYGDMMPGNARVVEIWNGPWAGDSNNEATLALWYDWLNQGRRLAASAGTDTHGRQDYAARPGFNIIYAESLTEAALLRALVAGKLYLSSGPQLEFYARSESGRTWMIGDAVDEPVVLHWACHDAPANAQVRLIANGRLQQQWSSEWAASQVTITPNQADWVVLEVRALAGELLAITNPVFFGQGGQP
jgi:hypothetical protein